jgi:hypothetical protein
MSLASRWRRLWRHGQRGQALVEQGVLLATLLGGLAVGGVWLMKTHPQMLNMINIQVRSYYFVLSLPLP